MRLLVFRAFTFIGNIVRPSWLQVDSLENERRVWIANPLEGLRFLSFKDTVRLYHAVIVEYCSGKCLMFDDLAGRMKLPSAIIHHFYTRSSNLVYTEAP